MAQRYLSQNVYMCAVILWQFVELEDWCGMEVVVEHMIHSWEQPYQCNLRDKETEIYSHI